MIFQDYAAGTQRALNGSIFDQVVKKVCKPCNEGWMEALETEVESVLFPLIRGEETQITPEAGLALARWAAKNTGVASYYAPGRSIPRSALQKIRAADELSDEWFVGVATSERSGIKELSRHYGITVLDPRDRSRLGYERVQEQILVLGQAIIYSRFRSLSVVGDHIKTAWTDASDALGLSFLDLQTISEQVPSSQLWVVGDAEGGNIVSLLPRAYTATTGMEYPTEIF